MGGITFWKISTLIRGLNSLKTKERNRNYGKFSTASRTSQLPLCGDKWIEL